MKKIVALLLAGIMTFSMAACGNSSEKKEEPKKRRTAGK